MKLLTVMIFPLKIARLYFYKVDLLGYELGEDSLSWTLRPNGV